MTKRYNFDQVKHALFTHWGLHLYRGGEMGDGKHDGRWDVTYSRTGYVVNGALPGRGHGSIRYRTLTQVVESCDLVKLCGDCEDAEHAGECQ